MRTKENLRTIFYLETTTKQEKKTLIHVLHRRQTRSALRNSFDYSRRCRLFFYRRLRESAAEALTRASRSTAEFSSLSGVHMEKDKFWAAVNEEEDDSTSLRTEI